MKARPILFSTPMVQAKLEGRKNQTRRLNNLQEINANPDAFRFLYLQKNLLGELEALFLNKDTLSIVYIKFPYGDKDSLLWVRETYQLDAALDGLPPSPCQDSVVWYYGGCSAERHMSCPGKLRPSIHMPRWASRLTLEITDIRVERLQDISEEDALAEGVFCEHAGASEDFTHSAYFKDLWESINGDGSWGENPWVWVIEFKVHKCNIDDFLGRMT